MASNVELVRVATNIANKIGEPVPRISTIRRASKYAGLDGIVITEWGREGLTRFIASLFPHRSGSVVRKQTGASKSMSNEQWTLEKMTAPIVAPIISRDTSNVSHPFQMTHEREDIRYLVSIDSGDRDKKLHPLPNNFRIDMGDTNDTIRGFRDVSTVEIVSVIVPKHTVDGDNVDDYPYILLTIPELGGIYDATNAPAEKAFAKLRFANDLGAYREYRTTDSGERFIKKFNPIRSLYRFTLQFTRPSGVPYNFGTKVMRRPRYCNMVTVSSNSNRTSKKKPMYFDGEQWLPIESTPARTTAAKSETTATTATSSANATTNSNSTRTQSTSTTPTHLDDLPSSEVSVVLRVTCTEMKYNTSNMQAH